MSEPVRVALIGATGLVGRAIVEEAARHSGIALSAIARRRPDWLAAAPVKAYVTDILQWSDAMDEIRPEVLICAIGTTWRKAGEDEHRFRQVDHGLVLALAEAAKLRGATRMVSISAAGASLESSSFYLRVKGEVERDLAGVGFAGLDILRPGLLRGERRGDRRLLERIGIAVSPLTDLTLHGGLRRYRSIAAETVARAALNLAQAGGERVRVLHHDEIRAAAEGEV